MIAKIENIEIRGFEVKQSKKDGKDYMVVRFEDVTGKGYELVDRDMENQRYYNRGVQGDLYIDIDRAAKFTRIEICRFAAAGGKKND